MFRLSEMVFILQLPDFVQARGDEIFLKKTTFFSKNRTLNSGHLTLTLLSPSFPVLS